MLASMNIKKQRSQRGVASLMALVLLVLLCVLSVGLAMTTDLNMRKSENTQRAQAAQLQAESGQEYMVKNLKTLRIPGNTTESNFNENIAASLNTRIYPAVFIPGNIVTYTSAEIIVPRIRLGEGTFNSTLARLNNGRCRLTTQGTVDGISRTVSIDFELAIRRPAVFDYGLASKGQIIIQGNAEIIGVNSPSEASVLSATTSETNAILVDGNTTISGDLYAAGQDSVVLVSGNPTIAGSKDPNVFGDHIHFGVQVPDFPEMDTASLAPLATNVIDSSTNTSSKDLVFNNVRILAGTNPTFNSDVALNGIIYVEAPNIVRFEGKATITGMIVTEDNSLPLSQCQLKFAGSVKATSVDALPDTQEFQAVKQETGTFIAAPGFGVTFAGNFSAINGCIAADQLTFTGTAEGTVKGSVIGLTDNPTTIGGTVGIYVDRTEADQDPTGFVNSLGFTPIAGTYREGLAMSN
jgi:hypothetical protein